MVLTRSTVGLYAQGIKDGSWDKTYANVWGEGNAPFNQKFHLIINLAVGSGTKTEDGNYFGKQVAAHPEAFWDMKDTWIKTWDLTKDSVQSTVVIKSVSISEYVLSTDKCVSR